MRRMMLGCLVIVMLLSHFYTGAGSHAMAQTSTPTKTSTHTPSPTPVLGNYTKISAGNGQTCALIANGTAYCWGGNLWGQLGSITNPFLSMAPLAVTMPTGVAFADIKVSAQNTCALSTTGAAYCWGNNAQYQSGNGNTTSTKVPVAVTMPAGVTFTALEVGDFQSCALDTNGTVYCWGNSN